VNPVVRAETTTATVTVQLTPHTQSTSHTQLDSQDSSLGRVKMRPRRMVQKPTRFQDPHFTSTVRVRSCKNMSLIQSHLIADGGEMAAAPTPKTIWTCNICGQTRNDAQSMRQHKRRHKKQAAVQQSTTVNTVSTPQVPRDPRLQPRDEDGPCVVSQPAPPAVTTSVPVQERESHQDEASKDDTRVVTVSTAAVSLPPKKRPLLRDPVDGQDPPSATSVTVPADLCQSLQDMDLERAVNSALSLENASSMFTSSVSSRRVTLPTPKSVPATEVEECSGGPVAVSWS